jgi:hypothetical protein
VKNVLCIIDDRRWEENVLCIIGDRRWEENVLCIIGDRRWQKMCYLGVFRKVCHFSFCVGPSDFPEGRRLKGKSLGKYISL